jgi:hypothetical protein
MLMRAGMLFGIVLLGMPVWARGAIDDFFETKVRPILATQCFSCHTNSQFGGLRLDSREAVLKGGKSGPAVAPGDPDRSLLIQAVRQTGELKMPKGGGLRQDEVDALAEWVRSGAPWPETSAPSAVAAGKGELVITPESGTFWSFLPLHPTPPPAVRNLRWPKTDIDRFVLARLERDGLAPVAPADRRTLVRRATLDLTGLPPSPEEVDAFANDGSPDAFARVVDRLLASPHYGERWGRLWLDVARYAKDDYRSLDPMGRGYDLLGIDHTRFTFRYSGRDFRLTDVAGNVIRDIIA